MTALKPITALIHLALPIGPEDVALMVDTNVYRSSSPWVGAITRHGVHHELYVWTIRFDGEDDSEGTYRTRRTINVLALVEGFARAANAQIAGEHHGLCCLDEMIADRSIATGCAQDTDVILQYTLFDELVYG